MKKIILSAAVISTLALVSCNNNNAQQQSDNQTTEAVQPEVVESVQYNVDPSSVVEWVGSATVKKHNGTINVTEGGVNVEDGKLKNGTFGLDINTIVVLDIPAGEGKEDLEGHLKGTDADSADHFFNVNQYPKASFVLNSFDGQNINGTITIKGKSKDISFPATVSISDNEVAITSNPFKINRTDFGVNYNSKSIFSDLKDKAIDDDIELVVKVKATK
ncbi:MAG: YceI family protein [Capnocytophaga sp.]|nr:YceI family protein [Capnocytophaga sp.]